MLTILMDRPVLCHGVLKLCSIIKVGSYLNIKSSSHSSQWALASPHCTFSAQLQSEEQWKERIPIKKAMVCGIQLIQQRIFFGHWHIVLLVEIPGSGAHPKQIEQYGDAVCKCLFVDIVLIMSLHYTTGSAGILMSKPACIPQSAEPSLSIKGT